MINDWFETFADNYEKSPWKISFYTGISYMFITVLVYLTHINRDNIFPKDLDILNIFPYALTKFFIVSVVIFVLIGDWFSALPPFLSALLFIPSLFLNMFQKHTLIFHIL